MKNEEWKSFSFFIIFNFNSRNNLVQLTAPHYHNKHQ
jgi:hypothetical protein